MNRWMDGEKLRFYQANRLTDWFAGRPAGWL